MAATQYRPVSKASYAVVTFYEFRAASPTNALRRFRFLGERPGRGPRIG
jgi:hypothetical protein